MTERRLREALEHLASRGCELTRLVGASVNCDKAGRWTAIGPEVLCSACYARWALDDREAARQEAWYFRRLGFCDAAVCPYCLECPGHGRGGKAPPCCKRAGRYNGFGSDGQLP